uniref:Zinc finger protein 846 n=1 Tax=Cacopsylla melanoneura TaxID=428564 RepID=A0A8D8W8E0_9HEMI
MFGGFQPFCLCFRIICLNHNIIQTHNFIENMLDPMDISNHENFTIKTESEDDSNLTNDLDSNIDDFASTEIKQEPCDYKEEHNGVKVEEEEECLDTSIDVKYEFIETNQENNPLSDNIITLPKQAKPKTLGKKKNCKILVDPTVKFSVADIFAHCRGDPNLKPENINLEEEYKNFKKSKNCQFSALLESVSKNSSCELKASSDNLEKGHETQEESESPLVHISNIKEEVIDGVSVAKDSDLKDVCSKCANIQSNVDVNRLWFKSKTSEKYFCKLCLGSYSSIKKLKVHLDTHGTRSQFKCHQCTLSFSCNACLSKHVQNNHESDTYTCHNCSKPFSNKTKLIKHMTQVHEGITYTCATCLKTFPNKLTLRYHLKKHDLVKFHCAQCPRFYYIKQSLKNHIFSRHYSHSSFELKCRHCTLSFTKAFSLENHIRKCHNGKRFPCEKCDKTFSTKPNLKQHMAAQHEGKRITCPHCPEQFPYSQYLKHHIKVKHEGVKFKCKLCGKQSTTAGNLNKHVRTMHCERIPMPKALESVLYGE